MYALAKVLMTTGMCVRLIRATVFGSYLDQIFFAFVFVLIFGFYFEERNWGGEGDLGGSFSTWGDLFPA